MDSQNKEKLKQDFLDKLKIFTLTLNEYVSTSEGEWTIKGFIDVFENIYTISNDTKIVSKILEIQLFSKFLAFANENNYHLVLSEKQNWYPDISFVSKDDASVKFAVDLKTTYRLEENSKFCNGFTLGSHGTYFTDKTSRKNIQFPYGDYLGHYCLGVIYTRTTMVELFDAQVHHLKDLSKIPSVIGNMIFFAVEKWQIASDKGGSGNTANIGSIQNIQDIFNGNGIFKNLGEDWFDDYWMNFGKITVKNGDGTKKITNLKDFLQYRGKDDSLINPRTSKKGGKNE
jgi:Restriction endonuclease EcoRV